jgi:hypothetical protein
MDKTNPIYIEVRDNHSEEIFVWLTSKPTMKTKRQIQSSIDFLSDKLLSIEGLVILDKDQSLPENPYHPKAKDPPFHDCVIAREAYTEAQQDMLKNRFKKVIE